MKKSNKLLLGGFLTVILMITGIHIVLFAKYKNGNYTIYRDDKEKNERMQSFPNVSYVIIRNVNNATVQFGDSAAVEKDREDVIKYEQKGDSLIITSKYYHNIHPDGSRFIRFTLPYNVNLSAINSFLYFEKGKTDAGTNPIIILQRSHAVFIKSTTSALLGHVKLVASDSSIASFQGNTQMTHLEAQLSNSTLEYNDGDVGELSIVTDSLSRLSLQSKLLFKAKISTTPNNFY
jgi:hypothetical protein